MAVVKAERSRPAIGFTYLGMQHKIEAEDIRLIQERIDAILSLIDSMNVRITVCESYRPLWLRIVDWFRRVTGRPEIG